MTALGGEGAVGVAVNAKGSSAQSEPLAGAGGGSGAAGGVTRAPDALQKLLVTKSCDFCG